jgi:hypothetical protein
MFFNESVTTVGGIVRERISIAGEVNDRIFAAAWQGFWLLVASSTFVIVGVVLARLDDVFSVLWIAGAVGIVGAPLVTYCAISIHREDARAARQPMVSAEIVRPAFPPPTFVEYLYSVSPNGDVPAVSKLEGRFPTAQVYLKQMHVATAIEGRAERKDGGTLVWTRAEALRLAYAANPGYSPAEPD